MPSIVDCIQRAMADPDQLIGGRQGQAAIELAQELEAQYRRHFDLATAQAMARRDMGEAFAREAGRQRRAALARVRTATRMRANIEGHLSPSGRPDPAAAPMAILEWREGSKIDSVQSLRRAMRLQFMGEISAFLRQHGKDIWGRDRNPAALREIVSELHGQGTGSQTARDMAAAITAAFERARLTFNSFGGDIGRLANYGLPHSHDVQRIRNAQFSAWRDVIGPRLDWSRIEDFRTGRPFGAQNDDFLQRIYTQITTRGWEGREPAMQGQGRSLSRSRDDHRHLHFRNGEDWWAYNERFGSGTPFDAVVAHLDGMARDIALLRVLGPNPRQGLDYAIQHAQRIASRAADPRLENAASSAAATARAMLSQIEGSALVPGHGAWAAVFAGIRNVNTGALLGSAVLSSVTDLQTIRMAAHSVGMNRHGTFARAIRLMASNVSREEAASLGYVADTLLNTSSGAARFVGEMWSPEVTRRVSDTVMRASGLNFWSDTLRNAFQLEFAAHLAAQSTRRFQDLEPALRRTFEMRGFTEVDWDQIRHAPLFQEAGGGRLLAPAYFRQTATHLNEAAREGLATRLQAIIDEQTQYAVPLASVESRARVVGEAQPGTVPGEMLNSFMQFKSFPITSFLLHIRRAQAQGSLARGAMYFGASFLAGMTFLGALAIQLKEISKGRDPRDMTERKFWMAAFLQGGGLGIFGDFLYGLESRAGGDVKATLAGPVAGALIDAGSVPAKALGALARGEEVTLGRDVTNFMRRYTPGTSLWYARTALDRAVWDQMQSLLDPEAEKQWRQQERRRIKEYGNQSFWARGEPLPSRAPDLTNMAGGS